MFYYDFNFFNCFVEHEVCDIIKHENIFPKLKHDNGNNIFDVSTPKIVDADTSLDEKYQNNGKYI